MIKSMTGFGRGEAVLNGRRFIAEIKTVNNRHRDLFVRLPRTLQAIEDGGAEPSVGGHQKRACRGDASDGKGRCGTGV